jgi:hypothetical protein
MKFTTTISAIALGFASLSSAISGEYISSMASHS